MSHIPGSTLFKFGEEKYRFGDDIIGADEFICRDRNFGPFVVTILRGRIMGASVRELVISISSIWMGEYFPWRRVDETL